MFRKKGYVPPSHAIYPYTTDITKNKIVLSRSIRWYKDTDFTHTNNNVLVVGDKTKTDIVKQNILIDNSNFVIVDSNGKILSETKKHLQDQGYQISIIDFNHSQNTDYYNPFLYFTNKYDPFRFAECLIENIKENNIQDNCFRNLQISLLQSIIFYIANYEAKASQRLSTIIELLEDLQNHMRINTFSKLDIAYEKIKLNSPNDIGFLEYQKFVKHEDEDLKSSVINTCLEQFRFLKIPEVNQITSGDTINLNTFGDKKQALFIITPGENSLYKPLISTIYMQLMDIFYYRDYTSSPFHIRFFIDIENIGKISNLAKMINCLYVYNMSSFFITPSLKEIKDIYDIPKHLLDGTDIIASSNLVVFQEKIQEEVSKFIKFCPGLMKLKKKEFKKIKEDIHCLVFIYGYAMFIDRKI